MAPPKPSQRQARTIPRQTPTGKNANKTNSRTLKCRKFNSSPNANKTTIPTMRIVNTLADHRKTPSEANGIVRVPFILTNVPRMSLKPSGGTFNSPFLFQSKQMKTEPDPTNANGNLATSGPIPAPASATRTNNFIGRSNFGDANANAIIDEFRVWSVARSGAQLQAGLGAPLVGNETGLVLYYRFDSASGTVVTNSATATGAAFNGTLVNSPGWVPGATPSSLVDNTSDDGAGSLRNAINITPPGGFISFDTNLSGQTLYLTNGQLVVTNNLTIDASALAGGLTLSGAGSRILFITPWCSHAPLPLHRHQRTRGAEALLPVKLSVTAWEARMAWLHGGPDGAGAARNDNHSGTGQGKPAIGLWCYIRGR
jgi:hypothetical protein